METKRGERRVTLGDEVCCQQHAANHGGERAVHLRVASRIPSSGPVDWASSRSRSSMRSICFLRARRLLRACGLYHVVFVVCECQCVCVCVCVCVPTWRSVSSLNPPNLVELKVQSRLPSSKA